MIEIYFSAPKTIQRLRAGLSGPFIDGFANALQQQQHSPSMVIRSLHAASHFGWFVQHRGGVFSTINERMMKAFRRHLKNCHCYQIHNRRNTGYHAYFGMKRFHRCEDAGEGLHAIDDPCLAMREILLRNGIIAA
jgi:hypothetical protein